MFLPGGGGLREGWTLQKAHGVRGAAVRDERGGGMSGRAAGNGVSPLHPPEARAVCYVSRWGVEGMDTNSLRMFLAISTLFWAIRRAFWMSWYEYP